MADLRLTAAARADLVEIRCYSIVEFGGNVADIYFRGFKDAFALLRERPFAGAQRSDLPKGVRCLLHRRHKILYQVNGDRVLIVRVIHHAQNAKALLLP
jgi:toxin ParE1/3/4